MSDDTISPSGPPLDSANGDVSNADLADTDLAAPDMAGPDAFSAQSVGDATDTLLSALANDAFATDHALVLPMDDQSLLGVCIVSADALSSVEHTLDMLTTSVDLFDVTPFDFGSDHTS